MHIRSIALIAVGVIAGSAFSSLVVFAWTGPTQAAPAGNVPTPINVGTTNQVKNAGLSLNSLVVFGNTLISGLGTGVGSYLNFDYTSAGTSGSGSSGYGIRDNAGTLEFKSLGGSWQNLNSIIMSFFVAGSNNAIGQVKFSDGTVQTTAAPTSVGTLVFSNVTCIVPLASSCTATCPAGYSVTGGGFVVSLGRSGTIYTSNVSGNGWFCSIPANSGTCTAICAKIQQKGREIIQM